MTTTITLHRNDLLRALGHAARVVERRNTIPILSNLKLTAAKGQLTITATDLDIEIVTGAEAELEGKPGACTVPAHTLHDIARKLPETAEIAITFGEQEGRATLRGGRARFTLQTLPPEDYPDLQAASGEASATFSLPASDLAGLIARTEFAISTEETRYYLNGIYLHAVPASDALPAGCEGGALRAVATDGHRLARATTPLPAGADGMPGIIIPRKALGEIARLAKEAGESEARLAIWPNRIVAHIAGATLASKLIDGTYPDYARVIPAGNPLRATIVKEDFARALERVSTMASDKGRAVRLAFQDNTLRLSVRNPDAGEAQDEIEVDYDGAPIEIGFNSRYLLDILATLPAAQALMRLDDPSTPTILAEPGREAELLCVLMPMRV